MSSHQRLFLNMPMQAKRLRIGEAAKLLGLEPYVLRFWESEFPQLAPLRTEKGQRLYSEQDLELIRRIQNLLHDERLTIDGARRRLDESAQFCKLAQGIAQELTSIRELLATSRSDAGRREHASEQEK